MDKRTDRLTAVQVDLAVNIAGVYGMAAGVLSLHQCGTPLPVIQRVLIQSGPRRGSTSALPAASSPDDTHVELDAPKSDRTVRTLKTG